jgi:hypothetical protein
MKTLIQKDLKENLKVALIGLLIFSVVLLAGYRSCSSSLVNLVNGIMAGQQWNNLQPILASEILVATTLFCAIFGTALGWLQTRNEAHRDLWAFLIHRPITRTRIFLGKVVAGLCLYVFGAGLPLTILVAVVRTPGHVAAPFEWAMIIPLLLIFLMGIAFYFAGLLTGLRQARWYVSRSFGLGLAIIAALGVFAFSPGWLALGIVIAVGVLATAAWGAYTSGGFYRGQPMVGRLSLIVSMAAGCCLVFSIGTGLLSEFIVKTDYSYSYSAYQIIRDGTIYQEFFWNIEVKAINDLSGISLLDAKTGLPMDAKEFRNHLAHGVSVVTGQPTQFQNQDNLVHSSLSFFNLLDVTDKTLWYLDRHGNLLGYDGQTRKFIGSLNPHGDDGTLAVEPFQTRYHYYFNPYGDESRRLLPTAKTVYQVDFRDRSVKPVFTLTNDVDIAGYADGLGSYEDNQSKSFLITTHKTIRLMDHSGKSILNLPYEPSYLEYPQVQVNFLQPQPAKGMTNQFALWFYPDGETNRVAGGKMPIHVIWLGPEQTVTKTVDLPTLPPPEMHFSPSPYQQIFPALLPPVLHVVFDEKAITAWNGFGFALAFVLAIGGGLLARYHRFPVRACVGWFLLICLLGIGGLLALLCTEEWPKREACPHCKKLRTVENEACEHCQSPFLSPPKNGTEIFAPLTKV